MKRWERRRRMLIFRDMFIATAIGVGGILAIFGIVEVVRRWM